MAEHRRSQRRRTLKGGTILFGAGSSVDCVIRNMSDTGAAIEVEGLIGIPDNFRLIIKPELARRNCRVAWRTVKRIGVQFV